MRKENSKLFSKKLIIRNYLPFIFLLKILITIQIIFTLKSPSIHPKLSSNLIPRIIIQQLITGIGTDPFYFHFYF